MAYILITGTVLSGCGEIGLCSKTPLDSQDSPGGQYKVEIIAADCLATSKADWVVLSRTSGLLRQRKIIAVVEAGDDDTRRVKARWVTDQLLYVRSRGASVWSFQPYWRDVQIEDK
ncbi:MAG: hypothetical protein ACXU8U_00010 [Asticcacaulis sp.]